jgi:hypothetical protein
MEKLKVGDQVQIIDVAMSLVLRDLGYSNYIQIISIDNEWIQLHLFEDTPETRVQEFRVHRSSTLWSTIQTGDYVGNYPIIS